jgi:hypothetical protein
MVQSSGMARRINVFNYLRAGYVVMDLESEIPEYTWISTVGFLSAGIGTLRFQTAITVQFICTGGQHHSK